jgi:hypothetical protein
LGNVSVLQIKEILGCDSEAAHVATERRISMHEDSPGPEPKRRFAEADRCARTLSQTGVVA